MKKPFFFCVLAIAVQVSLQMRAWPPLVPAQPEPAPTPVLFPPTWIMTFPYFCDFAIKGCHRYHTPRNEEMCQFAAANCYSNFDDYCPTRIQVCRKFDRVCKKREDPLFQEYCNLSKHSCGNVLPIEIPIVPASINVTEWCQTIMPACIVATADCRLRNPACTLFSVACSSDTHTELLRSRMFCRHLLDAYSRLEDQTMAALAQTYFETFECSSINNAQPANSAIGK